jgi:hypothetical protein
MVSKSTFSWEYKDIEDTAIRTQASRRKDFIIRAPEERSNRGLYSVTLGLKAKGIVKFLQVGERGERTILLAKLAEALDVNPVRLREQASRPPRHCS